MKKRRVVICGLWDVNGFGPYTSTVVVHDLDECFIGTEIDYAPLETYRLYGPERISDLYHAAVIQTPDSAFALSRGPES